MWYIVISFKSFQMSSLVLVDDFIDHPALRPVRYITESLIRRGVVVGATKFHFSRQGYMLHRAPEKNGPFVFAQYLRNQKTDFLTSVFF